MAEKSKIGWTDATHNEWLGCTKISTGCKSCYAETLMKRHGRIPGGYVVGSPRILTTEANRRKPFKWDREAAAAGVRRRVFTNSLSDVFDEAVSDEWRDVLFARMALTPNLDWLVLTKRAENMRRYCSTLGRHHTIDRVSLAAKVMNSDAGFTWSHCPGGWHLPNVWLGVSCEDQARADERIPLLLQTPAAVRFVSYEPALGPLDVRQALTYGGDPATSGAPRLAAMHGVDWLIAGGESGPGARQCDVAWVQDVVAQCKAAGAAVFVKQLGANVFDHREWFDPPAGTVRDGEGWRIKLHDRKGADPSEWPEYLRVQDFPRAAAPGESRSEARMT